MAWVWDWEDEGFSKEKLGWLDFLNFHFFWTFLIVTVHCHSNSFSGWWFVWGQIANGKHRVMNYKEYKVFPDQVKIFFFS